MSAQTDGVDVRPRKKVARKPAGRRQPLDKETVDWIVDLYSQGLIGTEIQKITGVPRGSVYYHLHQRGIEPDRLGIGKSSSHVNTDELLDRLAATERECGKLRAERDRLQATLDTLMERYGIVPRNTKPRRGSRERTTNPSPQ